MRICDDERAFREAVADGLSAKEAAELLSTPKHAVKLFTRRLPKQPVRAVEPKRQPVQVRQLQPAPIVPPAPEQDESDTDLEDIDGDV